MFVRLFFASLLAAPTAAWAQAQSNEKPPAGETALPAETKAAKELPAPPKAEAKSGDEISIEEWNREDWALVKPEVRLLDLDGYYRARGNLFYRFDLGNGVQTEANLPSTGNLAPRYAKSPDGNNNLTSADMRLRLTPRINVSEQIQIITMIDVLDNIVLGSNANTYTTSNSASDILSTSQQSPVKGLTSVVDAIQVKRVFARATALNEQLELRVGRMGDHWGLGMMTNSGDCLDCDYGNNVDRLGVMFKFADHVFAAMYDWVATGPQQLPFGSGSLPVEAVSNDDINQYSVRITHVDHPQEIAERTAQGKTIVNYGWLNQLRIQDIGLTQAFYGNNTTTPYNPTKPVTVADVQRRDSTIYTTDAYAKLYFGGLELGAEAAFTYGSFRDPYVASLGTAGIAAARPPKTSMTQFGGALEAYWHLRGEARGTTLSLKTGAASGNNGLGYGALGAINASRSNGSQGGGTINNFQFSPDYHLDFIMFRRIIGTVTDAWYVRPAVSYQFSKQVQGSVAGIYSQAMRKSSTPGNDLPMGLEGDAELTYGSSLGPNGSPLQASLQYGFLLPFAALKNGANGATPEYAQSLQLKLFFVF